MTVDLARIFAHEADYLSTIAAVEQRDGYLLFCNPALPSRYDPNHAGFFRAPAGSAARIVAEIYDFYQTRGLPPVAYLDSLSIPDDLEKHLLKAGFAEPHGEPWYRPGDLMFYAGPDEERPSAAEVIVAGDDESRTAWAGIMEEDGLAPEQDALMRRLYATEISDPRIIAYLALLDGRPAGRCLLFSAGGVGRVESVCTAVDMRRRGAAAAVVRRAVQDSQAQGNELTYLFAQSGGDPQRLYSRLGFRTVARDTSRIFIYHGTHR